MRKKFSDILKENGEWSLTRFLIVLNYVLFVTVSFYLIYKQINWSGYPTFASLTGGGGAGMQAVNKYINGKYNTPLGECGKPETRGD